MVWYKCHDNSIFVPVIVLQLLLLWGIFNIQMDIKHIESEIQTIKENVICLE